MRKTLEVELVGKSKSSSGGKGSRRRRRRRRRSTMLTKRVKMTRRIVKIGEIIYPRRKAKL